MTAADEWKEARATIGRFDSTLADVRKFGFSLVTALITLEAFLNQASGQNMPPQSKVAVTFVTVVLIAALFGLDSYYSTVLTAAVERALDLEQGFLRTRPQELSAVMTTNARRSATASTILILYLAFLLATVCLGVVNLGYVRPADVSTVWARLAAFASHPDMDAIWGATWLILAAGLSIVAFWSVRSYSSLRRNISKEPTEDPPDDTHQQGVRLLITAVAGTVALVCAVAEGLSGAHYLRIVLLTGLMGAEAIVGYFYFAVARAGLALDRAMPGQQQKLDVRLESASLQIPDTAPPYVQLKGQHLKQDAVPVFCYLDHAELHKALDLHSDEEAQLRLPPQDPRSEAAWQAGSAFIQLRTKDKILLSAITVPISRKFADALNSSNNAL